MTDNEFLDKMWRKAKNAGHGYCHLIPAYASHLCQMDPAKYVSMEASRRRNDTNRYVFHADEIRGVVARARAEITKEVTARLKS